MFILLYVIFFACWSWLIYKKHGLNISTFIVLLYLLGAINCFCIYEFYPDYIRHPERITLQSVCSHILLLWLFIYPLARFGNTLYVDKLNLNQTVLDRFSWCVIIPSISSIAVSCFDIGAIFAYGNFKDARMAAISGEYSNLYVFRYGFIGYIMAFGPQLSFIATFLTFYYKFYLNKKGLTTNLLLISSLSIVINNLAIAGREGFIRWLLFCIVCGIFMKHYIKIKQHKKLFFILFSFAIVIIVFFTLITIDRFDDRDMGPFFSILRYSGEQFYLFSYNYYFFFDEGYGSVAQIFPVITQEQMQAYNQNALVHVDYFLNTFSTFVGTFVKLIGFYKTLILSCLSFIFLFFCFWKAKSVQSIALTKTIAFLFYYEIILLGFFYFLHFGRITQGTIAIYILLAAIISSYSKQRRNRFISTKS